MFHRLLILLLTYAMLNSILQARVMVCVSGEIAAFESSCKDKGSDLDGCGKKNHCPVQRCLVCTPGCCTYLIPERPVMYLRPVSEERSERPAGCCVFVPQPVLRAIWHPPAAA